jgi:hypothetical protein
MKGVFPSYACSNWLSASHRVFLFLGVFLIVIQKKNCLMTMLHDNSISDSTIASMKALYAALTPAAQSDISGTLPSSGAIKAWTHHLSFGHWLGVPGRHPRILNCSHILIRLDFLATSATSGYGRQIAVALLRNRGKYKSSAETLGLLLEELRCLPNVDRGIHLDLAIGVYAFSTGAGASFVHGLH